MTLATSFDFDLILDAINGNDQLTHYAVLDAISLWAHENGIALRPAEGSIMKTEVLLLDGPTGWPVVRVIGNLDFTLAVARVNWPDFEDVLLLDSIKIIHV